MASPPLFQYLHLHANSGGSRVLAPGAQVLPARAEGPPGQPGGLLWCRRGAVPGPTGSEGPISALKRQYGRDRTRLDTTHGTRTWAGYGVLAHNLVKISTLAA
jgi:hypothetical protein